MPALTVVIVAEVVVVFGEELPNAVFRLLLLLADTVLQLAPTPARLAAVRGGARDPNNRRVTADV